MSTAHWPTRRAHCCRAHGDGLRLSFAAPAVRPPTEQPRRIPLNRPTGLVGRAMNLYAERKYGQEMDNLLAMAHNPGCC